ncbi:hypothetical protein B5S31_g1572 [[Candida] boidinii]|nr:hypothetical protein B5S31_g1572 [[Candida] boidinii]GME69987.1 unnamed protein product [[Candida] boidinii]
MSSLPHIESSSTNPGAQNFEEKSKLNSPLPSNLNNKAKKDQCDTEDVPKSNDKILSTEQHSKKKANIKSSKSTKEPKAPRPPKSVPRIEHYERLSYLYQLGTMTSSQSRIREGNNDGDSAIDEENDRTECFDILSRVYLKGMNNVSKKTVLKLSPNIKRTICKKCQRSLILPGANHSNVRMINHSKKQNPENDILEISCYCGKVKRFPVGRNPDHVLFSEKEDILFSVNNPNE